MTRRLTSSKAPCMATIVCSWLPVAHTLERHVANGTIARHGGYDLRVHRAHVAFRRRRRSRRGRACCERTTPTTSAAAANSSNSSRPMTTAGRPLTCSTHPGHCSSTLRVWPAPTPPQCAYGPRGLSSPGAFRRRCARLTRFTAVARAVSSAHQAANAANELFPGLTWMQYPSFRSGRQRIIPVAVERLHTAVDRKLLPSREAAALALEQA